MIKRNKVKININVKGDFFNKGLNSLKRQFVSRLILVLARLLALNQDKGKKSNQENKAIQFNERKKGVAGSKIENKLVIMFKFLMFLLGFLLKKWILNYYY